MCRPSQSPQLDTGKNFGQEKSRTDVKTLNCFKTDRFNSGFFSPPYLHCQNLHFLFQFNYSGMKISDNMLNLSGRDRYLGNLLQERKVRYTPVGYLKKHTHK